MFTLAVTSIKYSEFTDSFDLQYIDGSKQTVYREDANFDKFELPAACYARMMPGVWVTV